MMPALTATAAPVRRFGVVFVPHGERPGFWDPRSTGTGWELSPILQPLAAFKSHMTVVSQLDNPLDGHATTVAGWLSGSIIKRTAGEDVRAGVTVDQVIAARIAGETPMRSLELATEDFTGWIGGCDPVYSCTYMNTISWKNETTPLPMEIDPRSSSSGCGRPGSAAERRARMATDRSILDSVQDEIHGLQRGLGRRDTVRLNGYLEDVREISNASSAPKSNPRRPCTSRMLRWNPEESRTTPCSCTT